MARTILVTGATGQQGGSTIRALLAKQTDYQILALTRNTTSASAKKLASLSPHITLIEGDLNNPSDVFVKASKVATNATIWGVFSVQTAASDSNGASEEEVQGKALVDAALAHKVEHFVYASVDRHGERSLTNPTKVPHFISKHNIEKHLISSTESTNMRWTILRPVAFMDNIQPNFFGKVFATLVRDYVRSRPLQLVATNDIGFFAAEAIANPDAYAGRELSLAGDEVTFAQLDAVFQRKTGSSIPTTWSIIGKVIFWLSKELNTMITFFEEEGYDANIEALRKIHPKLQTLEDWIETSSFTRDI